MAMDFNTIFLSTCVTAVFLTWLCSVTLFEILFVNIGIGREIQPIEDFPYQCRRIAGPGLEACEDMWFSERTRQLYLACSDSMSRKEWMPNIGRLNISGRSLEDKIIALDVDKPIDVGFEYRVLEAPDLPGVSELHLVGLTGVDREDHVDLYLVNNRPALSRITGEYLDQTASGANSTIEHFRIDPEAETMEFVQTFADMHIATPNNIATRGDGSFYFTNDHGLNKVGFAHTSSPFIKNGDVGYCNQGGCRQVDAGLAFPNGLSFGADGLLYVPSSFSGNLRVYETQPDGGLKHVHTVKITYPLDNLSLDANGDLWVPGLPDIDRTLKGFDDPMGAAPPSTIFRIHKHADGLYEVDKMLEDLEGKVLPATTTALHDAKTGRIFLSSVISPFITVCEPKAIPAPEDASDAEATAHEPVVREPVGQEPVGQQPMGRDEL